MTRNECDLIQPLLGAYLDGELEGTVAERLAGHLKECTACRETVQRLSETDALFEQEPIHMPSEAQWKEMEERILFRSRVFSVRRTLKAVSVAAAGLLLLVALWWFIDHLAGGGAPASRADDVYTTQGDAKPEEDAEELKISVDRG